MHPIRPNLSDAVSLFAAPPVTRFAPSPTGFLHLGHVVNAIYTWGVARALGGRVILRIEDHDRVRSRREFDAAIREDLDWLGFVPDEGRTRVIRQSDALDVYHTALAALRRTHHVYVCDCSRADIGGERYTGRCRQRGLRELPGRGVRVELDSGAVRCLDLLHGDLEQVPAEQCGDLLVKDRDGHFTYQFSVTVDDLRQSVTLVVRGSDLLSSSGRQVLLGRMLGRATPVRFLHHPLLLNEQGEKLSKSAGDTGVRELRSQGLPPEAVIGRAAAAVGLIDSPRHIPAADVATLFGF